MKKLIVPSILSCDFSRLKEEIDKVRMGGADCIHVDIMDGHFVPNISIGIPVVEALRKIEPPPMDIHLMIENPEDFVSAFIEAGSPYVELVTVQVEACHLLHSTIKKVQSYGVKCGVALNPATSVSLLEEVLGLVDVILVMTVEPGFGGQSFIESTLPKIRKVREMVSSLGNDRPLIEVDGGIKLENIERVARAGADIIVSGSGIFKTSDYAKTIEEMKKIANSCDVS